MKKQFGIAVRYADIFGNQSVNTIKEHNQIFQELGSVFVGKYGRSIAVKYLQLCSKEEETVKLLLVKRGANNEYVIHQADVELAQRKFPTKKYVPAYYHHRKDIGCWFKLCSLLKNISKTTGNGWATISSGRPLKETMKASMSGMFYVAFDPKRKTSDIKVSIPKGLKIKSGSVLSDDALLEDDYILMMN